MNQERGGYFFRILVAIDQLLNCIFGGDPDETLSAKAHRKRNDSKYWNWFRIFVNKLFFLQEDHCKEAYEMAKSGGYKSHHYK